MARTIKIKKGFDIKLNGEAKHSISSLHASHYAVKPTDFTGIFPRLLVKEGDEIKAGTALFCDKINEKIVFGAPVSGTIKEIKRGDKRLLLEVIIEAEKEVLSDDFGKADPLKISREEVIEKILASGLWPVIRQRPYKVIANPADKPKSIFISAFNTAPLAADYTFVMKEIQADFLAGLNVLSALTDGKVHVGCDKNTPSLPTGAKVECTTYSGPHPSANISVHIANLEPINKGDIIWTVNMQDVAILGRLFTTGKVDTSAIVALAGVEVENPQYFKTYRGASVASLTSGKVKSHNVRYISGDVLTGTKVTNNGFLSFYDDLLTVIAEGNTFEFLGWALPGAGKLSFSATFLSKLIPLKKYNAESNLHGGERALVMTGIYEKLVPLNVLPMQLIKACIIEDIDLMEKLGIYEVDEEDFALCEFADPSKTEIQSIIRKGLNLIRKEMN
jgi:Na+-transporting NADH:ubiquinone oxidoreductase subunit A